MLLDQVNGLGLLVVKRKVNIYTQLINQML